MSITKSNIIQKINQETLIPRKIASKLLESFLNNIKDNTKINSVKISGFGTFSFKKTPNRIGRNPKNKDSYIIPALNKLNFKSSNKLKANIN